MSGMIFSFDADTVSAFDNAYWLSKPGPVRPLRSASQISPGGGAEAPVVALAKQLMQGGYQIDLPVMVWQWDAYLMMYQRWVDGFSWVPAAGQMPGGGTGPVPSGAIPVPDMSLPLADLVKLFPAFDPPPPPVVMDQSPVGPAINFEWEYNGAMLEGFFNKTMAHFAEGTQYKDATGVYVYHLLGTELMSPNQRIGIWLKMAQAK